MRRFYKFLLRPTSAQTRSLSAMLADHCDLYNAALQERRGAYAHPSRTKIRYGDQSAQLKGIRAFDPDGAGRWSFSSQQATLRRLNRAFEAFFRRVKVGEKPGYPRFRSQSRFDTVDFPKDGDACRWDSTPNDRITRVRLQVLSCDDVPTEPLPPTGREVGIDLGVTHFLTTSDGEHLANPRLARKSAARLAVAQRTLDSFPKKVKAKDRSKRRRQAASKVARLHAKVRRQRIDHTHKAANFLIRSADVIAHEKLPVTKMIRRPKPKRSPDGTYVRNGAAAKAGLNKSILDAGWGVFLRILAHKAECAGRELIPVDPRNTSRTCPTCGHVASENRNREIFECTACGRADHADRVAALNIATRAGLALHTVA